MSEKTWRNRSTDEQVKQAIKRACRVLKGTSIRLTRNAVARQAARYLENRGALYVLRVMEQMSPDELNGFEFAPDPGTRTQNTNRTVYSSERWR